MGSMRKDKYRPLTARETEWIDYDCQGIESANNSISGLARTLGVLAEMVDDKSVDTYYREELRRRMIGSIAYAIDELTKTITDRQGHIQETLEGMTAAVIQTRLECIDKRYSPSQEG